MSGDVKEVADFRLAPMEPTEAMIEAGLREYNGCFYESGAPIDNDPSLIIRDIYRAMMKEPCV